MSDPVQARSAFMSASGERLIEEPYDFPLALGGPVYQLWRRSRLSGDALDLLRRRAIVLTPLAWAPLLLTMFSLEQLLGQALKILF